MDRIETAKIDQLLKESQELRERCCSKRSEITDIFSKLGYSLFDNVADYPDGLLVSPELLEHKDWADHANYDDEDEILYIYGLLELPIFVGDNDWKKGYHLIGL